MGRKRLTSVFLELCLREEIRTISLELSTTEEERAERERGRRTDGVRLELDALLDVS
jgi:hypothetical protein